MRDKVLLTHKFVEFIPRELEANTIYVSIAYATAIHSCCCGCGNRVVTPISPTDWKFIFDGRSISLEPSIGNWSFPCRSHYWIRNNRVVWSDEWSNAEVDAVRKKDARATEAYFEKRKDGKTKGSLSTRKTQKPGKRSLKNTIKNWLGHDNSESTETS
jgi:hypothetical protein